jgi:hypothetical protein
VKNLVNCQYLLCTEAWRHSKLARRSCKIRWEKHPMAFVKVVEGSEIYNFPIHHSVHFSSNFWRKTQSNRRWLANFGPSRRSSALERRRPTRARSAWPPPSAFGPAWSWGLAFQDALESVLAACRAYTRRRSLALNPPVRPRARAPTEAHGTGGVNGRGSRRDGGLGPRPPPLSPT